MADRGLAETASGGVEVESLRVLRDMLALDLERCDSMRDKAALAQRFVDTLARISVLEKAQPRQEGTALDELTRRRSAKRPASSAKGAAGK